jgi:hypothetical protein
MVLLKSIFSLKKVIPLLVYYLLGLLDTGDTMNIKSSNCPSPKKKVLLFMPTNIRVLLLSSQPYLEL